MKNVCNVLFICLAFVAFSRVGANDVQTSEQKENAKGHMDMRHLKKHLMTSVVVNILFNTSIYIQLKALEKPDLFITRSLMTEEQLKFWNIAIKSSILVTLLGKLYAIYKTPQWTDSYLLNYQEERTTKQNIIAFLNRFFLGWPLGIITGELMTH